MALYRSKQSVLDEALGEFVDYGFKLEEPDDHVLVLYFKDKQIAIYNQPQATFDLIKKECHNFMVNKLSQDNNDCYREELTRNG